MRKNGRMIPYMGRNQQLHNFKMGVKEELGTDNAFYVGKVELCVFFWRQRAEYITPQARSHRKHEADGTNMMKATEDALQGVLFKNDKDTNECHWTIVEQGPDVEGKILLGIREAHSPLKTLLHAVPDDVLHQLDEL